MMQPLDQLSELASCCGLVGRRRGYKLPRNYFYSPSTAHLNPGNGWALANPYMSSQPQPYILLTQPVIIAGNPPPNQTNTMTLVQHAQSAQTNTNTFPALSLLGSQQASPQHQAIQPNIVPSQYAIYNSSAALNTSIMAAPTPTIYESHQNNHLDHRSQNLYFANKLNMGHMMEAVRPQQAERVTVTLNSEVFRQLELIEKQVDLNRDMDIIERHGIVITRALDPYSLMPHLTEDTLKRYHAHFLFSENYVIRFIEIIKRPGQTLGLYIRTVQFEYPQGRGSREGLVITKIDSESPIYNSQVLHVGDEILSVNLVDIQGMSLDDVVVIMSIPKRLVLALRIPKDRSELLSINLTQQQQQLLRGPIEQSQENTFPCYANRRAMSMGFRDDRELRRIPTSLGLGAMRGREPGLTSMNDNQVNELRREISRRGLNMDRELHHAQPVRVQSAMQTNETHLGGPLPSEENHCQENYDDGEQRFGNSTNQQWQSYAGNPNLSRNTTIGPNMINQLQQQHYHHQHHQPNEQRIVGQLDRQVAISKSRDGIESSAICPEGTNEFQDFELNADIESLERSNLTKEKPSLAAEGAATQVSYSNNELSNNSLASMTSTFPRRTLPSRPDMAPSPTPIAIRNPIINNVRLGDTPEQSSYFSSSIDAINRELKELRRQRMALSNNEHSLDLSRVDF